MTDTPAKKPRTSKQRIYRVEDDTARGGFYQATSTTQAKSMAVDRITVREATNAEIMDIGKRGIAVFGMTPELDDSQPGLDGIESQPGAGGAPQIQDHANVDDDQNGSYPGDGRFK